MKVLFCVRWEPQSSTIGRSSRTIDGAAVKLRPRAGQLIERRMKRQLEMESGAAAKHKIHNGRMGATVDLTKAELEMGYTAHWYRKNQDHLQLGATGDLHFGAAVNEGRICNF